MDVNWAALVAVQTRDEFVAAHPYPFLVGVPRLVHPQVPSRTGRFEALDTLVTDRGGDRASSRTRLVVPVCKVQEVYPSMITVGRTRNNDIVIDDILISKFHAFFRVTGGGEGGFELADAGSQNGTQVGDVVLEPKGGARPVACGDLVRFASAEFTFVDAGGLWDELRSEGPSRRGDFVRK